MACHVLGPKQKVFPEKVFSIQSGSRPDSGVDMFHSASAIPCLTTWLLRTAQSWADPKRSSRGNDWNHSAVSKPQTHLPSAQPGHLSLLLAAYMHSVMTSAEAACGCPSVWTVMATAECYCLKPLEHGEKACPQSLSWRRATTSQTHQQRFSKAPNHTWSNLQITLI